MTMRDIIDFLQYMGLIVGVPLLFVVVIAIMVHFTTKSKRMCESIALDAGFPDYRYVNSRCYGISKTKAVFLKQLD